jgi:hypothetical protein
MKFGTLFTVATTVACTCQDKLLEYLWNFLYLWGGKH